jgi:hypothetical protein
VHIIYFVFEYYETGGVEFCLGRLNVDIKLKKRIPVFALGTRHCVHYESRFDFFAYLTVRTDLDLSLM